ncbi:MAG: hypothetical protein ACKVP0_12505 [Pirellulaceae bacterium]
MDFQAHVRANFAGKRIILVGNAPFTKDCTELIDQHDIVVRFNLFESSPLVGRKIHYWLNNLVRDEKRRKGRTERVPVVRRMNADVVVGTPHEPERRLATAIEFYKQHGFDLLYPDLVIPMPCLGDKQPRTGFYTAIRLMHEQIPVSLIAFTDKCDSPWHDGPAEMRYLRKRSDLATIYDDF